MTPPPPAPLDAVRDAVVAGDLPTAAAALGLVLAADPDDPEARYWLASALLMGGDAEGAARALDDARTLHGLALARQMNIDLPRCRRDGDYAAQVAAILYDQLQVAIASVLFGMARAAETPSRMGLLPQARALQHQGRIEEAIAAFKAAADASPSPTVDQFGLYPLLLLKDPHRYVAEARRWAARYAPGGEARPFANGPAAGRKLRVGYVAPSFATSQVRQFIAPVLAAHDRDQVEIVLYPQAADSEAGWPEDIAIHPIGGLGDAEAAALIRGDRIDVLADCWGHTAGSRLPVFALRPAPVQVAWINFLQTTGLTQIDYVLHADAPADLDIDGQYTEGTWLIGPVFNAFLPPADRAPPTPTPALATGQVTFGSFNHPCKLSAETLRAWGRILKAAPRSRLLLKYRYFIDPVLRRVIQAQIAACGVAPERVVFEGESRGADYLAAFGRIDLALDTSPAPGSTTTLDALANGVPVLTLAGAPLTVPGVYARSMVEAVGLPELATAGWDDYVQSAVDLTADLEALNRLRARVRPGFDDGPLRDEVGFTRRVEAAFREMFERARRAGWAQRS